MKSNIIISI